MKTRQIEIAVARYFNYRQNIVVPNVSWGLEIHEVDVLVVRPSGYAIEVEIKTSVSDLKADSKKLHGHRSGKIRELWFAIPSSIYDKALQHIPDRAGILIVAETSYYPRAMRNADVDSSARKLHPDELRHLSHLGCMRVWGLKRKLENLEGRAA
jgi:hypothetical protein